MTLNSIIANFQTFKLADLLDIVIIAFLIYQLLGIINRTRAGQLAKGALLVLAVYLVANVLNMRTVTWLLNSLLQVGLLTLVVLFQPEIRRALERMGQTERLMNVTLCGPAGLLDTLVPEQVVIEIDADDFYVAAGQQNIACRLYVPSNGKIFALGSYVIQCKIESN